MLNRGFARRKRGSGDIAQRNLFTAHTLGAHWENSVDDLKGHLHEAGLLTSPTGQLDAVMVEDLDHFYDLISEHGIPLARDLDSMGCLKPGRVRIDIHIGALLAAGVTAFIFVLDDVLNAVAGLNILPW